MGRTETVIIRPANSQTNKLAAEIVANGGLIAFRTDTFYGLGVDPLNETAVARIKAAKGREEGKPILLLISDTDQTVRLTVNRPKVFDSLSQILWPGPLTIVMKAAAHLPEEVTAGTGTIGLRLPDDENVLDLVRVCGGSLTATSANRSGEAPARSAHDVQAYFSTGMDLIIDGGEVTATEPSTVIDITHDSVKLIREGAVTRAKLETALGFQIVDFKFKI